jgi:hypothetical protein
MQFAIEFLGWHVDGNLLSTVGVNRCEVELFAAVGMHIASDMFDNQLIN